MCNWHAAAYAVRAQAEVVETACFASDTEDVRVAPSNDRPGITFEGSKAMQNCILAAVLLTAIAAPTSATGMHDAEDRSAEAVQRADDAWGKAEAAGDSRYVDWLLLPDYVSIGPDGRVHDKAAIVSHTKARRQGDAETAASIAAWRLAHPYRTQIRILGDTAIVSFISTKNQSAGNVNSSDIFVYRGGHWHAAYSQHSAAESV